MAICIPKEIVQEIKALNLPKLTSLQRVQALDSILGPGQGKDINLLYEKSLLLKNQEKSFSKFIDDLSGVTLEKRTRIKESIQKRLQDKTKTIDDQELLSIVKEALDKKYDLDIPDTVVADMFKLRKEADELSKVAKGTPDGSPEKLAYGQKLVELSKIVDSQKNRSDESLLKTLGRSLQESKTNIQNQKGTLGKIGTTLSEVVGAIFKLPAKGIKAAWDASFLFRQGLKVLTASPEIWAKSSGKGLKSWTRVYSKEIMEQMSDAFKADIVSRDLYQDAIKSKLAIGVVEDFFPTNIAEKIPALGNLFKASDDSFTMFSQGARMELFEKYVNAYTQSTGNKPSTELMKDMAQYVNGLTGRGGLGKAEAVSSWLNQIFFSARYQVANLKTFSDPLLSATPEVQSIAAKNLAKHLAVIFGGMTTLSTFTDVGFDPRESTFGKVRIPGSKKWVDVTGGLASYISLLGRMSTKLDGKLAPVPGAARDYLEQRDYTGKKPTALSTLNSLFTPITADNIVENYTKNEDEYVQAWAALLDIIGTGVSQPKSKKEGSYNSPIDLVK